MFKQRILRILSINDFSGGKEKSEGAFTGDSRSDANSPEFDWLYS